MRGLEASARFTLPVFNYHGPGFFMKLIPCIVVLFVVSGMASVEPSAQALSCKATPMVLDTAPPDRSADPVGPGHWYINADRSMWVAVPGTGWPAGGKLYSGSREINGQKTYWVRPRGSELTISGRRLDTAAPPLEAHVPCCYPTGFQIVGLHFPTEGCWEVTATAGDKQLQFVTQVKHPTVRQR